MALNAWGYLAALGGSILLASFLTPLALRIATRRQVLDHPGSYKMQESPVPYLGGVAIVVSFSAAITLGGILKPPTGGPGPVMVILGLAVVVSLLGLVDDLRGIHPVVRFGVEIAAAYAIWDSGVGVSLFDNAGANAVLTILWIVGITNAFNLLDNMDGLSAGTAAIASAAFFVLAIMNGQVLVAALSIALCGCAIGFLRHNFHPARIYMGDAGSLFLGFLLAILGIKLEFEAPREITFMVPALVLGVAIFDTSLVTISRLLHKKSPFAGGRDHVSHRLVFVGIPVRAAVSLVYAIGLTLGWLAIVMSRSDRVTGFILMGLVFGLALFAGTLLEAVPVYSSSKRRRLMIQEVSPHEEPADLDVDEGPIAIPS